MCLRAQVTRCCNDIHHARIESLIQAPFLASIQLFTSIPLERSWGFSGFCSLSKCICVVFSEFTFGRKELGIEGIKGDCQVDDELMTRRQLLLNLLKHKDKNWTCRLLTSFKERLLFHEIETSVCETAQFAVLILLF